MREPQFIARIQTALAFHRWKRHAASLSAGLDRQEQAAVIAAYNKGNKDLANFAYIAPQLNSTYRQYLYLTDNLSDDGEEVDTDNLGSRPKAKKDHFYDTAEEAMPDLTTSGDNVHLGAALPEPALTDEEKEKLETEMKQVENDISVLQDVLHNKLERLQTIRRTLGLETNQNIFTNSIHKLRDSDAYKKTTETVHNVTDKITHSDAYHKTGVALKTAGEKTKETLTTVGATMSRKLGDMRNSNTFKSFEERMGSAYTSVKDNVSTLGDYASSRLSGSRSEDDIQVTATLPEQKVPL